MRYSPCKHGRRKWLQRDAENTSKDCQGNCHRSRTRLHSQSDPTVDPFASVGHLYLSPIIASQQPKCEASREQSASASSRGVDPRHKHKGGVIFINVHRPLSLQEEGKLQPLPVLGCIHFVSLSSLVSRLSPPSPSLRLNRSLPLFLSPI